MLRHWLPRALREPARKPRNTRPLSVERLEDRTTPAFTGGASVAAGDWNHDGYTDIATGAGPSGGPHVKVFSGATGEEIASFYAFNEGFTGGVSVALGDVDGDGWLDLIAGAGGGGGPHVKAFSGRTGAEIASFFAYAEGFAGGVNVGAADLDGDGVAEILTGAGAGGPHVKAFSVPTGAVVRDFMAFDPAAGGGVSVAGGDMNGDGRAEIVAGAGPGAVGAPVRVFDGASGAVLLDRPAFEGFFGGARVAVADVDGDGANEILAGAMAGGGSRVRAFELDGSEVGGPGGSFFAYGESFTGGVFLTGADLTADGTAEIVTGAGPGGGAHVKGIVTASLTEVASFIAYDPVFTGGGFSAPSITTPPSIALSPLAKDRTNTNPTFSGVATDAGSGVAGVSVSVDGGAFTPLPLGPGGVFAFTTAFPLDNSADGPHTVHFRATDRAGNVSAPVSQRFTLDTVPPTATLSASGSVNVVLRELVVTVSEPPAQALLGQFALTRDGTAVRITSVTLAGNQFRLTLADPLPNGDYQLALTGITDAAGNAATPTAFTFTVLAPPAITSLSPSDGTENVSLTRESRVTFNVPVDAATVTADSFYLIAKGAKVPGSIRVAPNGLSAIFYPTDPLPESTAVRAVVDGGVVAGRDGVKLDGDGNGTPGGQATADFRTLPLTLIPNTRVFGYIYDSYAKNPDGSDVPVAGVKLSLDANAAIFATTDANGFFELGLQDLNADGTADGLPTPDFFVHIDGSTATSTALGAGSVYATLGKPFHSVPGQRVQLRMDGYGGDVDPAAPGDQFHMYLPPMSAADVVALDPTADTTVGFGPSVVGQFASLFPTLTPEQLALLSLMSVTYPAGSAVDGPTGTAATQAMIVPVNPLRLPAPLPPGQNPSLVISIQAGTAAGFNLAGGNMNFETPAPVTFPNLDGLLPGEKTYIWSFDHDAGKWVTIGTGTVSADGKTIVSDPGVGILAPGWHFPSPPGTKPEEPEKKKWEELSYTDVLDDVWTVGKAAFDCIKNMTKVLQVVGAVLDQVDALKSIVQNVNKLAEDIKAGNSLSAASDALAIIEVEKDKMVSLYEAASSANPVSKAVEAAACGVSLANAIISRFCTDKRKECYGTIGKELCDLISPLLDFAKKLTDKAKDLEKSLRDAPLTAVCLALNEVKNILAAAGSGGGGGPLSILGGGGNVSILADEWRGPAVAELEKAALFGGQFEAAFTPSRDAGAVSGEGVALFNKVRVDGLSPVASIVRSSPGAFWRMTVGAAVSTGRANSGGDIDYPVIAPNSEYKLQVYDFAHNALLEASGVSAVSGGPTRIQLVIVADLSDPDTPDADKDGLADVAEGVIGTAANKPDTDGDGVTDFAEVREGTNPLDGTGFPTGVIASLSTPGSAEAVAVANDLVYVATGSHGLALVDAAKFDAPVLLGQIDLDGNATDVAVDPTRNIAAVATGSALVLVDVSDPMMPKVTSSISVGVNQVEVLNGFAFAATGNGIAIVDLATGDTVGRVTLPGAGSVTSMAVSGTLLFAYVSGTDTLAVVDVSKPEEAAVIGQLAVSIPSTDVGLFAGNGVVWLAGSGLRTVDVTNPAAPTLISNADSVFTSRRVALNGSGLALVTPDGGNTLSLYDSSDPAATDRFLTRYDLSGPARGVAVSRGIGYVAAGGRLEVVNYRPFDADGVAPTVSLQTDAVDADPATDGVQVLEGTALSVRAITADDVQVRSVEFLVNGVSVGSDVSFPFEAVVNVPPVAAGGTLTIQVRATDTGGNSTLSELLTLRVVPDTFAPTVERIDPADGSSRFVGTKTVRVRFSETLAPASITAANFTLVEAGADGEFGTADDVSVPVTVSGRDRDRLVQITAADLPEGRYRLSITEAGITDLAGNPLGTGTRTSTFTVVARPTVDALFTLRGEDKPGDFILTGTDFRVGVNADGSFITSDQEVGLEAFGTDFLKPGTPLAGFTVSRDGENFTNESPAGGSAITVALQDLSAGTFHGWRAEGVVGGNLRLERVVVWNDGEQFFTVAVRLTNIGDTDLTRVAFLENHDPDQGTPIGVGASTTNDVVLDGRLALASVVNDTFPAGLTMGFGSADPRSVVSIEQFYIRDPFDVIDSPVDPNGSTSDTGMGLAFDFGTLRPGESVTAAFALVLGRSTDEAIAVYESSGL